MSLAVVSHTQPFVLGASLQLSNGGGGSVRFLRTLLLAVILIWIHRVHAVCGARAYPFQHCVPWLARAERVE